MEIKYWADIACPYSYIGITRMQQALAELDIADRTPLEFKSFQLDPTLGTTPKQTMVDYYAQTQQVSTSEALSALKDIDQLAATAGLSIQMEKALPVNSLMAHRLIKYVESLNDQALLNKTVQRLYQLYFTDQQSIADIDILLPAMIKLGLPAIEVEKLLKGNRFEDQVRQDERRAFMIGIPSAPLFVINNQYSITGAQPYEVFVASLKKIQEKSAR